MAAALVAAHVTAGNAPAGAQSPESSSAVRPQSRRVDAETLVAHEETRQAVSRAIDFLRSAASRDGGAYRGFLRSSYPVAETSLAGLALLACGVLPGEGEDADVLAGCLSYVLEIARRGDFLTEPNAEVNTGSRMHGHAYAVLFLTQVSGTLPREQEARVASAIRKGIRVIENAQSREGGWYYDSNNLNDQDEASVTICALQALRAAQNSGYRVDSTSVERAVRYVKRCQNADGNVRYRLHPSNERTSFALTAAAVSTLIAAGVYHSEELSRGLRRLKDDLAKYPRNPLAAVEETYFFYGNFYAAQALWHEGGTMWEEWYPKARERLLKKQKPAGNWESPFGDVYATATALLILEMPRGYLPIFER